MALNVDCRMSKSICSAVVCAVAFLAFAIACPQAIAKPVAKQKLLDSFCGFKAGEDESKIKVAKSEAIIDDGFRARSPFRSKFREVMLTFGKGGKLVGVSAYARLENTKPKTVKTELEACCKELTAKYNIKFGDWTEEDGEIGKDGGGEGVNVRVAATLDSPEENAKKTGATLMVGVSWDSNFIHPAISVKAGNYNAKSGKTRREFIENAFGMKFGEPLPEYIKAEKEEESVGVVIRRLSAPVCGCSQAILGLAYKGKLSGMCLMPAIDRRSEKVADAAHRLAKTKAAEICAAIEKWLGIAPLKIKEGLEGADGAVYIGGKPITASYEEGDICIIVKAGVVENKTEGTWIPYCQIDIDRKIFCLETKKRLEQIFLPSISFKPPNTVKDVFDQFRKATAESGNGDINFVLDKDVGAMMIPAVSAGRMSLYDAVKLVCGIVCCDFEVSRGKVVAKSRK